MHKCLRILLILVFPILLGCGTSVTQVSDPQKFKGKAVGSGDSPLANVLVVLQPMEQGFVTECETNVQGEFEADLVPGKYAYYFAASKKTKSPIPKSISASYLEPKAEHVVTIAPGSDILCKAE